METGEALLHRMELDERLSSPGGLMSRYLDVCSELKQVPNPYIKCVAEQTDFLPSGSLYSGFTLTLPGNSRLLPAQRLTDDDAAALPHLLQRNNYITGLNLSYNNFTNCGAEFIGTLLLQTTVLTDLNLMCNEIGSNGAAWIAKALQLNKSLKNLKMTGNKIGNKGGMHFATMLQLNHTLEVLDLGDCDLGIQSLIALATVLNNNKTVKVINVSRPLLYTLQEESTVHMAHMLQINQSLQELHLGKQAITNFGVQQLCEKLIKNQTLRFLDLRCNQISRDGAKSLATLLKHNTPLKILDLTANRIEDDGMVYISEALRYMNDQLIALSVARNSITSIGLVALANALKSNTTLTNVYIWGNDFNESACSDFANLLKVGRLKPQRTDISPYWINGRVYLAELAHGLQMHYYWTPVYGEQDEEACNAGAFLLKEPHTSISQIDIEESIDTSSTEGGLSSNRDSAGSL